MIESRGQTASCGWYTLTWGFWQHASGAPVSHPASKQAPIYLHTHTDVNAHSKSVHGRHVRVTATGQQSKWQHLWPRRTGFKGQERWASHFAEFQFFAFSGVRHATEMSLAALYLCQSNYGLNIWVSFSSKNVYIFHWFKDRIGKCLQPHLNAYGFLKCKVCKPHTSAGVNEEGLCAWRKGT